MSLLLALAGGGGGSSVTGSIAWTEQGDTLAVTGSLSVNLANAWAESDELVASVGNVKLTLSSAWTEQGDALAVAGVLTVYGNIAWTENGDTQAVLASIYVTGAIAYSESGETVAIAGSVASPSVTAAISWQEGGDTVTVLAHVDIAFAQLPRLPLDPLLPVSDDVNALMTRVGQVYRVIAAFHNTVTQSVAGDFSQLPLQSPTPFNLRGLLVAWNEQQGRIVARHNTIAEAVTGQYMADSPIINAPTVQSFRTQFYDKYRSITQNYNALAEIIDTMNGY